MATDTNRAQGDGPLFVGWDWGSTAHDVTVIDSAGDRLQGVWAHSWQADE